MAFCPLPPQVYLSGNYDTSNAALTSMLQNYKAGIDSYVCANVPNNPLHSVKTSPRKPPSPVPHPPSPTPHLLPY